MLVNEFGDVAVLSCLVAFSGFFPGSSPEIELMSDLQPTDTYTPTTEINHEVASLFWSRPIRVGNPFPYWRWLERLPRAIESLRELSIELRIQPDRDIPGCSLRSVESWRKLLIWLSGNGRGLEVITFVGGCPHSFEVPGAAQLQDQLPPQRHQQQRRRQRPSPPCRGRRINLFTFITGLATLGRLRRVKVTHFHTNEWKDAVEAIQVPGQTGGIQVDFISWPRPGYHDVFGLT